MQLNVDTLQSLFEKKRHYINHFFDHLDLNIAEEVLQTLLQCKGKIFFSGVGKSGLVAKKIADTMASTGTPAIYLCPMNAMHGDIGLLSELDICILFSKSGETDELLALAPQVRKKGSRLIGIVSNPQSRLAKTCDINIHLPLTKELCPFDLAPTTSTTIQMIFGDVLSIALMQLKKFSLDQYALNHPAGRIGKRITLRVQDLMLTGSKIPFCRPETQLMDTLVELSNKRCGCILAVDDQQKLLGIFTDGDLRRSLQKIGSQALHMPMEHLITRSPKHISPHLLAWEAIKLMEAQPQHEITVLPVVDSQQKVLGVLRLHDILQAGI